jgi:hypothetical protein
MKKLTIESWFLLSYFDFLMHVRGFSRIHKAVREQRLHPLVKPEVTSAELCHAVDLACVFYFKRVLCLQRSAATAVLLRRHGWKAELVIGAQLMPFKAHSWVEVDSCVVNDKLYMTDVFQILERC